MGVKTMKADATVKAGKVRLASRGRAILRGATYLVGPLDGFYRVRTGGNERVLGALSKVGDEMKRVARQVINNDH